jgi:hypothetical protein
MCVLFANAAQGSPARQILNRENVGNGLRSGQKAGKLRQAGDARAGKRFSGKEKALLWRRQ